MDSLEKKVIGITAFGHALCHFCMLIMAAALVAIVKDLNSSISQITGIGTFCYLIFGLGAFPSGMLVSRTNPKLILKGFFLLSGFAAFMISISKDINSFTIGLILLGLGASLYHVSGVTLITQSIKLRGRALGIHGMAGSAGIASAPIIAGTILTYSGWRSIYLAGAFLGIIGFLILQTASSIPSAHPEAENEAPVRFDRKMITAFVLIIAVMMINGLVYRGFLTMLPTYISQKLASSSIFTGGLISSLILAVGMFGQYLGGHLSDRIPMTILYFIVLIISLPFLFLLGFVQHGWIVVAGLLFALFHFPQQPIENHLISKWMPPRLLGSGFGIKFTATFGVGAFASGLTGIIVDRYSISWVFPILAGLVFLSSSLILTLIIYLKKTKVDMDVN